MLERRQGHEFRVDLEKAPQRRPVLAAAEAVGSQRRQAARHPALDELGPGLHVIADGNEHAGFLGQQRLQVALPRRRCRMQPIPALTRQRLAAQFLVAGHAPHVGRDAVLLAQHLLGPQRFAENRTAAEQVYLRFYLRLLERAGPESVHALQDAVAGAGRHRLHRVVFVVQGQIIEDVLAVLVHATNAVLDDQRDLIRECRIVADQVRHRAGEQVAVTIEVLQSFTYQRGAPRGAAQQEAARLLVGRGPNQIADALETEHRIVDVERNHRHAMVGVSGAGGDE